MERTGGALVCTSIDSHVLKLTQHSRLRFTCHATHHVFVTSLTATPPKPPLMNWNLSRAGKKRQSGAGQLDVFRVSLRGAG